MSQDIRNQILMYILKYLIYKNALESRASFKGRLSLYVYVVLLLGEASLVGRLPPNCLVGLPGTRESPRSLPSVTAASLC